MQLALYSLARYTQDLLAPSFLEAVHEQFDWSVLMRAFHWSSTACNMHHPLDGVRSCAWGACSSRSCRDGYVHPVVSICSLSRVLRSPHYLLCSTRSERALALLDAVDDGHIAQCTLAYARLFSTNQMHCDRLSTNRMRRSLSPNGFGVEVVWRTHMLHPLHYRACCEATGVGVETFKVAEGASQIAEADSQTRLSQWAGLDLVAAVRRCARTFLRA